MKRERTVMQCQFCRVAYKLEIIDNHEVVCTKNPRAPKRFKSNGKVYIAKTLLPAKGRTPLSLSWVTFMWDQPPVCLIKDDAFHLHEQGILKRTRHTNWFAVPELIKPEDLNLLWDKVHMARRAGAPRSK